MISFYRKAIGTLISTRTTLCLLLLFALAMASATFIEEAFDTQTANLWVYRAKWFEVLMLLLALNFMGNIRRYNLFSWRKAAGFLFHTAFLLILAGAAITRYFGEEGLMHIRENQATNVLLSDEKGVKITWIDGVEINRFFIPVAFDDLKDALNKPYRHETNGGKKLTISLKEILPHAAENWIENSSGGTDFLKLNVLDQGKESEMMIAGGSLLESSAISFNADSIHQGLRFFEEQGVLKLVASSDLRQVSLPDLQEEIFTAGSTIVLKPNAQYSRMDHAFKFIVQGVLHKAVKKLISTNEEKNVFTAAVFHVDMESQNFEVPVFIQPGGPDAWQHINTPHGSMLLGYGEKETYLPFSVRLNDFIIDRYPGSNAPSSFASEVTVNDLRSNVQMDYRIYMNHVLDYDGYRFFQSSYDKDEKGTVLSVNHDFWGTWITYLGYLFLGIGFFWTLFNKHSRFQQLARGIRELRRMRMQQTGVFLVCLFTGGGVFANAGEPIRNAVDARHAMAFSRLLVQTFDGRTEPVHTLSCEVLHKIARKDVWVSPEKGELKPIQVMLDIILDPEYWKHQKLIYVREKSVSEKLGIQGKYASYVDLTDANGIPKLSGFAEEAFRKKPADQNAFDKEVLKVSERLEIFLMLTQGSLLRLFPDPQAGSSQWISWDHPSAQIPVAGYQQLLQELNIPQFNYNNLMGAYLSTIYQATEKGDYSKADQVIGHMRAIQRSSNLASRLPGEQAIAMELYYNEANIFGLLKNVYALLAVVLLVLAYTENFVLKPGKLLVMALRVFQGMLAAAFLYHTFGLILRWYLAGHAPWSNGYEALLLIAWAGLLAGFSFLRYSSIPLAATALLAFFTLMTAGHSNYDPQLTNLQPVLKSYWLIIHVATLTISYGFLGLAFILGLFTLTLFLFKNASNADMLTLRIRELSHINEMNITIGLMLATLGTFLGGVWANESWGRYWGWDAKETWALIITMVYSIVVHLRLVDSYRGDYYFSAGAVLGFSSVLMTFIGVNYYLSKGMHSYASGETPLFPIWAWIAIVSVFALILAAWRKERVLRSHMHAQKPDGIAHHLTTQNQEEK